MLYTKEFPTEEAIRDALKYIIRKDLDRRVREPKLYFLNKQAKDTFEKRFIEVAKQEFLKQSNGEKNMDPKAGCRGLGQNDGGIQENP